MLNKITIIENIMEVESWKEFESDNILDFLVDYFKIWPKNAKLFHNYVCEENNITPRNNYDIEKIKSLNGRFFVVVFPEGPVLTVVYYVVMILFVAYTLLNQPKIPNISARAGLGNPSSNNELSSRVNKPRTNCRIPDIYGQVRSVPDLIALPYKTYISNKEVEFCVMCIGRGYYDIEDIKDDTTLISQIEGSSIEIFLPGTSKNTFAEPQLRIGEEIPFQIENATRNSGVNGQNLTAPGEILIFGDGLNFIYPNKIVLKTGLGDLTKYFYVDDVIYVQNKKVIYWVNDYYTINTVSENEITLTTAFIGWTEDMVESGFCSGSLTTARDRFVSIGDFYLTDPNTDSIRCNFFAPNGMVLFNESERFPLTIEIEITVSQVDENLVETGLTETFSHFITHNDPVSPTFGYTAYIIPTFKGRMKVSCSNKTPKQYTDGYQLSDEIKWKDLFGFSPLVNIEFGNCTTLLSLTTGTSGALEIKERKLNMLVTRKLPARVSDSTFTEELYATKNAADIISAIALDEKIGNRQVSEIDFDNIYSTIEEINDYFGTNLASEFSYTFDNDNMSFEEIINSIASSIFSIAYRRGNKIKLSFEKETEFSSILFNHRNKVPGTETRTISFGNVNNNDGIEFQYVNPDDDSIVSIYLPSDKSAKNPKKIESIGIRNSIQAHFIANRLYNKIKYQNLAIEFEATQESNIALINDKIMISDGTRGIIFDGEIESQNGLELTLSQNIDLQEGTEYTIFLQRFDGSIESIEIEKTTEQNKILLLSAPSFNLVLDPEKYSKTTFLITQNNDFEKNHFVLTEKTPKGIFVSEITAINYDSRYYLNDKDFINNLI